MSYDAFPAQDYITHLVEAGKLLPGMMEKMPYTQMIIKTTDAGALKHEKERNSVPLHKLQPVYLAGWRDHRRTAGRKGLFHRRLLCAGDLGIGQLPVFRQDKEVRYDRSIKGRRIGGAPKKLPRG